MAARQDGRRFPVPTRPPRNFRFRLKWLPVFLKKIPVWWKKPRWPPAKMAAGKLHVFDLLPVSHFLWPTSCYSLPVLWPTSTTSCTLTYFLWPTSCYPRDLLWRHDLDPRDLLPVTSWPWPTSCSLMHACACIFLARAHTFHTHMRR